MIIVRRPLSTIALAIAVVLASVVVGVRSASPTNAAPTPPRTLVCNSSFSSSTWSLANSPYEIAPGCTFTVSPGQTLTIQPGVTVYGGSNAKLAIQGTLSAAGQLNGHITFTCPTASCTTNYWQGIQFSPGASTTSLVSFADFSGANAALENFPGSNLTNLTFTADNVGIKYDGFLGSSVHTLSLTGASFTNVNTGVDTSALNVNLTLTNASFTGSSIGTVGVSDLAGTVHANNMQVHGLQLSLATSNGSLNVQNSFFEGNRNLSTGISISSTGSLLMSGSTIQSEARAIYAIGGPGAILVSNSTIVNTQYAFDLDVENNNVQISNSNIYSNDNSIYIESGRQSATVNAHNNWWGTTDVAAIQQSIHDCRVNNTLPCVQFQPPLANPANGATLTPTRTPTITATPRVTRTPTPTSTAVGGAILQLNPTGEVAGSGVGVTANGTGFGPSEKVVISYSVPMSDGGSTIEQTQLTSLSNGTFSVPIAAVVPGALPGPVTVTAVGQTSHRSATATLNVLIATPTPTNTVVPTPTPTNTPTNTPRPTKTPTATPVPKKPYVLAFKTAKLQYPFVRAGTWDRVTIRANHKQKMAVGLHVILPFGRSQHYAGKTNKNGYWSKTFPVPKRSIGKHAQQAVVVVQLQHGLTTKQISLVFTVVH